MNLLRRIVKIITYPLYAITKRVTDGHRRLPTLTSVLGSGASARRATAPAWRKSVRLILVALGLVLFVAAEVGIGYLITRWESMWWISAAIFVVIISAAIALSKPTIAYIGWLAISPIVYYFFQAKFGQGLPPITFDRVAVPLLTFSLIVRTLSNRGRPRNLMAAEWLLVLYVIWSGTNLVLIHQEKDTGVIGKYLDYVFMTGVLYFVTKAALKTREHVMRACAAITIVGFVSAVALIIEAKTGYAWYGWIFGRQIALTWTDIGQGRGQGLWLIPHVSQIFCSMTAFLAFHFAGQTHKLYMRCLCYAGMVVMILAVYYAYSRTGYIALAIAFLLMPVFARGSRRRYLGLAALGILVVAALLPMLSSDKDFVDRMSKDTYSLRFAINKTNISLIEDNMWTGVGFSEVPAAFLKYANSLEHRNSLRESVSSLGRPSNPHNWHLQILGEEGVIGGFFYYGSILAFLVAMYKISRRIPSGGVMGADLVVTFIVATIANLVVLNFYGGPKVPYPMYVFWIVFALMVRLGELVDMEARTEKVRTANESVSLQAVAR